MPELPVTLCSSAAKGDEYVCLTGPIPLPSWIRLSAGTPYFETVPAYACTVDAPYIAFLGLSKDERVRLTKAHCVGAVAQIVDEQPGNDFITAILVDAGQGAFVDLVGKQIGIRVDGGDSQSTTLVCVAPGEDGGTMLSVCPAIIAHRCDRPHRFDLVGLKKRSRRRAAGAS